MKISLGVVSLFLVLFQLVKAEQVGNLANGDIVDTVRRLLDESFADSDTESTTDFAYDADSASDFVYDIDEESGGQKSTVGNVSGTDPNPQPNFESDESDESDSFYWFSSSDGCPYQAALDYETGVCIPVVAMLYPDNSLQSARLVAVASLAAHHFNTRSDSVIASGSSITSPTRILLRHVRTSNENAYALINFASGCVLESGCALAVGPLASDSSELIHSFAAYNGVPLLSYGSTSYLLSNTEKYEAFSRTVPTDQDLASGITEMLQLFGWESIAILAANEDSALTLKTNIVNTLLENHIQVRVSADVYLSDESGTQRAMERFQNSGVRVIVMLARGETVPHLLSIANEYGLVDRNITWILPQSFNLHDHVIRNPIVQELEEQGLMDRSELWQWLQGTVKFSISGFSDADVSASMASEYRQTMAEGRSSPFFQSLPKRVQEVLDPEVEMTGNLTEHLGFAYDAMWLGALAAVEVWDSELLPETGIQWSRAVHQAILHQTIQGCSGPVRLTDTGDRDTRGMWLIMSNIVGTETREVGRLAIALDGHGKAPELLAPILWRSGKWTFPSTASRTNPLRFPANVPKDGFSCGRGEVFDQVLDLCVECPAGTFLDSRPSMGENGVQSRSRCSPCNPGTYSFFNASTTCSPCPQDSYQPYIGSQIYLNCPENSHNNEFAASSVEWCLCDSDYYTKLLDKEGGVVRDGFGPEGLLVCQECPKGGQCLGDDWDYENSTRVTRPPFAKEGFWTGDDASEVEFNRCRRDEACLGGTWETELQRAILTRCDSHYRDRQCNKCTADHHSNGLDCIDCPTRGESLTNLFYVLMPPTVLIGFFTVLTYVIRTFPSLTYSYMTCQIIALVGGFNINWGDKSEAHKRFLINLTLVNFNMDLTYLDCSLDYGFLDKWWVVMMMPFIHIFTVFLISLVSILHARYLKTTLQGVKSTAASTAATISKRSLIPKTGGEEPTDKNRTNPSALNESDSSTKGMNSLQLGDGSGGDEYQRSLPNSSMQTIHVSPSPKSQHDPTLASLPPEAAPSSRVEIPPSGKPHSPVAVHPLDDHASSSANNPTAPSTSQENLRTFTRSIFTVDEMRLIMKETLIASYSALIILLRAGYIPVLSNNLKGLICDDFGGVKYLRYAPEEECFSSAHIPVFVVSIIWLIIYNLGLPLFFLYTLIDGFRKNRLSDPSFERKVGPLYALYEPNYFWFGILNFGHMGALSVISVCIGFQPLVQILLATLVILCRMGLQLYMRPYLVNWRDVHTAACHILTCLFILLSAMLYVYDCENYEKEDPIGKCFGREHVVRAVWVILCLIGGVIITGVYMDVKVRTANKRSLPHNLNLFFVDKIECPTIWTWLEDAEPEVVNHLRDMDTSFRNWLHSQLVKKVPFNQFLLADQQAPVPEFLRKVLLDNRFFLDYCISRPYSQRRDFETFVVNFNKYVDATRMGEHSCMAALIDNVTLPYATAWLLQVDDEMNKKVRRIQNSWYKFATNNVEEIVQLRQLSAQLSQRLLEKPAVALIPSTEVQIEDHQRVRSVSTCTSLEE